MRTSPIALNNPTSAFEAIKRRTQTGSHHVLGGFVDNSFTAGKNFISSTFDVGVKVSKIVLGFLGLAGGAIAAAIFKENTAADWGSKVLMIAGAILGVLGVKDLINYNKDVGQKIEHELCYTEVGHADSKKCKEAISELSTQDKDPYFGRKYDQNEPGLIRQNKSEPAVRGSAIKLLQAYTAADLVKHAGTYKSGVEYQITNIDSQNVSLAEYGDRIALLLGYVSASGPLDGSEAPVRNLVSSVLQDVEDRYEEASVFDYDVNGKGYARILPTDFRDAFVSAKWYCSNHAANGSVNDLVNAPIDVDGVQVPPITLLNNCLTAPPGPTRDRVGKYLVKLQNTQNYLASLQRIIKYVLSPQNYADPVKARNAIILRQALICGLGLKGQNVNEINQELEKVLSGEERGREGLTNKLGVVSNYINGKDVDGKDIDGPNVSSIISDPRFPFERKSSNISGDDVLGGMTWYEFVKKTS